MLLLLQVVLCPVADGEPSDIEQKRFPGAHAPMLIDDLTTSQFADRDAILKPALSLRDALVRIMARTRQLGSPVLYVKADLVDLRNDKEVLDGLLFAVGLQEPTRERAQLEAMAWGPKNGSY